MRRLLFEKKGDVVWISHLDLMRLFQRAFKRAGLKLKHTQGFNPRPSVSIALPLSVGVESQCELLDFDLEGESVPFDEIRQRLNQALIPGVSVKSVYEDGKKIRDIAFMQSQILLYFPTPVTDGGSGIEEICRRDSLPALKKSKNGQQEVDIAPMIRSVSVEPVDGNTVRIDLYHCCQNPTLNPMLLTSAIERADARYSPDLVKCRRLEIFDKEDRIFR